MKTWMWVILGVGLCSVVQAHGGNEDELEVPLWEEEVPRLRRRDPEEDTLQARRDWNISRDLAEYIGIAKVDSIALPVTVTLLFIGFHGDGRGGLSLDEHDLVPWCGHIRHAVHHMFVDTAHDGMGSPEEDHAHNIRKSNVQHSFRFRVLEMDPVVNQVIEASLSTFTRKEDEANWEFYATQQRTRRLHVDASRMSRVLGSLVHALNLSDSYTLLIMNPRPPQVEDAVYGYRMGFSDAEMNMLLNSDEMDAVEESMVVNVLEKEEEEEEEEEDLLKDHEHPHEAHKEGSWSFSHVGPESRRWAKDFLRQQKVLEELAQREIPSLTECPIIPTILLEDKNDQQHSHEGGHEIPFSLNMTAVDVAYEYLVQGSRRERDLLHRVRTETYEQQDCLVDVWVAQHGRFAWLDLSAGPFSYGPVVGGLGVRTKETLPSVEEVVGHMAADKDHPHDENEEDDAPMSMRDSIARHAALDADADRQILVQTYERYCRPFRGRRNKPPLCKEIEERLSEGQGMSVSSASHSVTVITGDDGQEETLSEYNHGDVIQEAFLSQLGATVTTALEHLVAPATSLRPTFYRSRIVFHVFVIRSHSEYPAVSYDTFDYGHFCEQVRRVRLPLQEFTFAKLELWMEDDEAIAAAFAASHRSAIIPSLTVSGRFVPRKRMYVDSHELRRQLREIHLDEHSPGEIGAGTRHVSVFLFSVASSMPMFVDKHYQARAVGGVVLGVQSPHREWDSHLQCNGDPIRWNLRDPTGPLIQATLMAIGGVLPTHMKYDAAYERVGQTWLWSVGPSVLSMTSRRAMVTDWNIDAVHRGWVISGLDRSVELVNEGFATLETLKISKEMFGDRTLFPLTNLTAEYAKVLQQWRAVLRASGKLDWSRAAFHLPKLAKAAWRFKQFSISVSSLAKHYECFHGGASMRRQQGLPSSEYESPDDESTSLFGWSASWLLVFLLADALLAALFVVLRGRRRKIKVN